MSEALSRRETILGELGAIAKAFASARRLEVIELLVTGEHTVEALARSTGMRTSTMSAHLQVLKSAGLVQTRRDGTRIYYRLAGDDVGRLYAALRDLARDRSPVIYQLMHADQVADSSAEVLVSRAELLDLLDRDEVALLDVRPVEEFEEGHIPGAHSAPLETLLARAGGFSSSTAVVAYCRGAFCVMAEQAVRALATAGIPARRLEDGMLEWRLHALPVASGTAS